LQIFTDKRDARSLCTAELLVFVTDRNVTTWVAPRSVRESRLKIHNWQILDLRSGPKGRIKIEHLSIYLSIKRE